MKMTVVCDLCLLNPGVPGFELTPNQKAPVENDHQLQIRITPPPQFGYWP